LHNAAFLEAGEHAHLSHLLHLRRLHLLRIWLLHHAHGRRRTEHLRALAFSEAPELLAILFKKHLRQALALSAVVFYLAAFSITGDLVLQHGCNANAPSRTLRGLLLEHAASKDAAH
jgi:hypothetical protein